MPFSGWRRNLLRAFTAVALYLGLLYAEVAILQSFFKRGAPTILYLPEQPLIVNILIWLAIPSIPLAVVSWFYKGRWRDKAMVAAALLFAALVWVPWLGTYSAPLPTDMLAKKAVANGYDVCGVYRATTEWKTYVYSETFNSMKRCIFIVLRPDASLSYGLRMNLTTRIVLLNFSRINGYTFYYGDFWATQFHLIKAENLPNFIAPESYFNPVWLYTHDATFKPLVYRPMELLRDDWLYWFTFTPDPGSAVVRITVTITVRAEGI
jgi:hypothetical protein